MPTFNCTGAGTAITPLKRPYYCCGWALPPLSFSGKYSCTTVGGSPAYPECDATDVPFTLTKVDDCYSAFGADTWTYTGAPGFFIYAFVVLGLCVNENGSDGVPGAFGLYAGPVSLSSTQSCSFDKSTGVYSFYFSGSYKTEFTPTYYTIVDVIVDTVVMP